MNVPMFDAGREYAVHSDELGAAAERVLVSGRYILGPEVEAFEAEVAAYLGVRHAIGCANGTDALWLALRAVGVGPGDLVLTTAFTFFATASAIVNAGATPVLADIDPTTFNIDPAAVEAVLEGTSAAHRRLGIRPDRIRTIVPVHLFGQPADMTPLLALARRFGLAVVEDAAQSFGATHEHRFAGTLGDAGCLSFFPTKNLGGFGDGGMVVTDRDDVAVGLVRLRSHGSSARYFHERIGTNSRLDELQAALLRVRLRHLDEALAGRARVGAAYDAAFGAAAPIARPVRATHAVHTFNLYVIRTPHRDELRSALNAAGVATAVHYPWPLHLQPALEGLGYTTGDFPNAEAAAQEVLSLPTYPTLSDEQIARVGSVVISTGQVA